MDDLSGLDWSKPTGSQPKPSYNPMTTNQSYPSLRPTPSPAGSGRSTPASNGAAIPSSAQTAANPATDSFSSLMSFAGQTRAKQNLSLAERQAQLEAEKRNKDEEKRKQTEAQFGNAQQWDALGSRAFTSSPSAAAPVGKSNGAHNDDDDLFAAFNKDTKVDISSHYPPPERQQSTSAEEKKHVDLRNPSAWVTTATLPTTRTKLNVNSFDEDDDPFGLNEIKPGGRFSTTATATPADDDDFLGDLGKPIEEIRMKQQQKQQQQQQQRKQLEPGKTIENAESSSSEDDRMRSRAREEELRGGSGANKGLDRAIAQLVDYGFSPEDARRGLRQSGSELNVQAAANWLLDDAHRKAKEKAQGRSSSTGPSRMGETVERRFAGSSGRGADTDLAKSAAAVGSSLFKTANSLWKTGQKKMQQAVADLQQDGGDPNQPKWMRDAQQGRNQDTGRSCAEATDEVLALQSGGRTSQSRNSSRPSADPRTGLRQSRTSSPAAPSSGDQTRNSQVPRWQQQTTSGMSDARSRLSRMQADDDDDSFSSHVTANRRKKTTPIPSAPPRPRQAEPDLLFNTEAPKPSQPLPQRHAQRQTASFTEQSQATSPTSRKATAKSPRRIPPIESSALQASAKYRLEGTAHFKRGDYATAQSSYSRSLSTIPAGHPLLIVLLTNRALTSLKIGETKQALNDADEALKLIGPGNGQGETVAVPGEDGKEEFRDMKELFGKALSRKAEALEALEKWADAGSAWQQCVEAGVGGATAIKGRQRCQNTLAPKPKTKTAAKPVTAAPRPKASATASLAPQKSSEAVIRLREANENAAREDDEKFALSEKVDAKVSAWRDGKRDNLRGLIASLDQVLWENSGWKKVGLHELVMTNKVKIAYMKAIAKTHPDKLPPNANIEMRLIAGFVFATLNESWDKFKADNGM